MSRSFTTSAVGQDPESAWRNAVEAARNGTIRPGGELIASSSEVLEVPVPDGVNPSKLGTWIERVAGDEGAIEDVPEEVRPLVMAWSARLARPGLCLAVEVAGDLGARMRKLHGVDDPDARTWLLFGTVPDEPPRPPTEPPGEG